MRQLERAEQCAVIQWAALHERMYPELGLLFAVPNGGSRNKIEAVNLKRSGVRPGVPDLCLPVSRHGYHAMYIEMKSGKGKLSPAQAAMIDKLKEQGNYATVANSVNYAIDVLSWYLGIKNPQSGLKCAVHGIWWQK